jgi:DNA-binding transcriptional LysR family regulator
MDTLTAMRYVIAAAETHSFTAAANRLHVTPAAVTKLVTALEKQLSTAFFVRTVKGLTLTAQGERYSDGARQVLAQVERISLAVSAEAQEARGTLILATQPEIGMLSWLTDFHKSYPDVQLEVRNLTRNAILSTPADAYLLHGWPDEPNLIQAQIAQTRFITCAAPSYWQRLGIPAHPNDLTHHSCLLYAVDGLTVNDLWGFQRDAEHVRLVVHGWLQSNNRPTTINAAVQGAGIIRVPDLLVADQLRSGQLIPTLTDWTMDDPPPIQLLYGQEHRNTPRMRLFVNFLTKAFNEIQAQISPEKVPRTIVPRPYWSQRGYARASDVPDDDPVDDGTESSLPVVSKDLVEPPLVSGTSS